jgi:hypothetical protein
VTQKSLIQNEAAALGQRRAGHIESSGIAAAEVKN